MSLNRAQKEAVSHYQGPCMVLAGPGSGKTLTIAKRIEYLIKEYKVRPEEILVITFTKYAAAEMRQRFYRVMGNQQLPVTFGTFHGIFYGILKWAYRIGQDNLLLDEEKSALVKEAAEETDWGEDEELLREEDFLQGLLEEIANVKNNRLEPDLYESKRYGVFRFREVYERYEEKKRTLRKLDFEDMLLCCYQLFEQRPDILEKWQQRYTYILVDEFQDINQVQYDVVKMLAAPSDNLFVVGDDDQSIYGFRGARPGIMMEFPRDYKEAKQVLLDVNYRSTAHIVNGALRVIEHNKRRYKKSIRAGKKAEQVIHVQEVKDPAEESRYITEQIKKIMKDGIEAEEIAVLYRTASDAGILAETLLEEQLPFQMKEHLNNLYDHAVGQDIEAYFHLALGQCDRKCFLQVANKPNRFIGRDSMSEGTVSYESLRNFYCDKKWMQDRIDQWEWDMKMIRNKTPYTAIQYLRKSVGYDEYLKDYAAYRGLDPAELREVLDEIQERSKGMKSLEEWFRHVDAYRERLAEKKRQNPDEKEGVSLLTMHGAKGLEFDTVFILGANEGIIPYKKALAEQGEEEERRLFYVAMTRAKNRLVISYVKEKNGREQSPSRFVGELFQNL